MYSLVNEGAQILEEKIAQRASDIDVVYLTGYGFPIWRGGPMLYADTIGLFDVVRRMKQFAANPRRRRGLLEARAAAGTAGRRGRHVQRRSRMSRRDTDAVIVSTARTPLAKSWKGAFNMTHGATLGGHVVKAAIERARHRSGRGRGRDDGLREPGGRDRLEHRAPGRAARAGCPVTVPGVTVNRFCSSGLQTIALASQRVLRARARSTSPAASSRSPACSRR